MSDSIAASLPAARSSRTIRARVRDAVDRARQDSLLRNSMYIMATTVVTGLLGYVYWILAAREYPAQSIGLASALISALTLTSSLCNLGIHSTFIQVLPGRTRGNEWSRTVTAGILLGSAVSAAGAGVAVALLPAASSHFRAIWESPSAIALLVAGVPLWTVSTLLDATFIAERRAVHMLLRNGVFSLLKVPLLVLPLFLHMGFVGVLATWVAAAAVSVAGAFVFQIPSLDRDFGVTVRGLVPEARGLLGALAGHHVINLGSMAPMYLFPILVASRVSVRDSAYFYTTWMVCSLFFIASPAVAQSLFAEGVRGAGTLTQKVRKSSLLIAVLLAPAGAFFLLAGGRILSLFGPSYAAHGTTLLLILLTSAVPDAVTNIYVSVLRVRGHLRRAGALNLGMALLALLLAWLLLPSYGIAGAGLAWGGAQTAGALVALLDLARGAMHRVSSSATPGTGERLPGAELAGGEV